MKIVQITENLIYGDGISNVILEMDRIISKYYESYIASKIIDTRVPNNDRYIELKKIEDLQLGKEDIIIYHFGGVGEAGRDLLCIDNCKKIILYQNVTYPFYFCGVHDATFKFCAEGQRYIRSTSDSFLKAIVPSNFSREEMISFGWESDDIYYLPLPISLKRKTAIEKKEKKGKIFLSVGRIVPNKKVEDVIRVYEYYKKRYDEFCSLKIVGKLQDDTYSESLLKYINKHQIRDIEFLNHVSDDELNQLYSEADYYLCMSEHEGFCLPLIEAMKFGIPVLAYGSTAVIDTMGKAGIVLESKENEYVCKIIDRLNCDSDFKTRIIDNQYQRIEQYDQKLYEKELLKVIKNIIDIQDYKYDGFSMEFYNIFQEAIDKKEREKLINQIKKIINHDEELLLYGAGIAGQYLLAILKEENIKIEGVCDSNITGKVSGYEVVSPEESFKCYPNAIYVVTVQNDKIRNEITKVLNGIGVEFNHIYYYQKYDNKILV